jgi:murein DD-endopeptidase MepM/ murein hydrolase activator NlpD
MKKSLLIKKKSIELLMLLIETLVFLVKKILKVAFTKRTIMFVTNEKIRSINLGPVPQLVLILVIAWLVNIFNQSIKYNQILEEKSREISRLKSINSYFEDEFDDVSKKLKKVNEYLIMISGEKHNVKEVREEEQSFNNIPKNVDQNQLSKKDRLILSHIEHSNSEINDIHLHTAQRINKIHEVISMTGLNIKKSKNTIHNINKKYTKEASLNNPNDLNAKGGPSDDDGIDKALAKNNKFNFDQEISVLKFTNDIDYLMVLEKMANSMPFDRPMKNYFISSGFGVRADPLTHRHAQHNGLDFVGVANEKILSPSPGKVILAGRFSDYGNAVVIDHGYGITTRYGHLSSIKVKEGDRVRRGEVIAFQGSTGKSTGAHLHYEVRYKNIPLNPRKFLEAGDLFKNDSKPKYVNS